MKDFFALSGPPTHQLFGLVHLSCLFITFIIIILIYFNRHKLKKIGNPKTVRYIMAGLLFANMLVFYVGSIATGTFSYKTHLPLHYCYITGFLFMFMLLTDRKKMYSFLYYAVFMCTITVIIWQDNYVGYDRYEFYLLLLSHHFLLISSMYTLFVLDYPVTKKGLLTMGIYSILIYVGAAIFNYFVGSNYIFSDGLPQFIKETYPFVIDMNPMICLLIVAIPLSFLGYLPLFLKKKDKTLLISS